VPVQDGAQPLQACALLAVQTLICAPYLERLTELDFESDVRRHRVGATDGVSIPELAQDRQLCSGDRKVCVVDQLLLVDMKDEVVATIAVDV